MCCRSCHRRKKERNIPLQIFFSRSVFRKVMKYVRYNLYNYVYIFPFFLFVLFRSFFSPQPKLCYAVASLSPYNVKMVVFMFRYFADKLLYACIVCGECNVFYLIIFISITMWASEASDWIHFVSYMLHKTYNNVMTMVSWVFFSLF